MGRDVRLTLLDSEVQSLKAGEIYEVAPAIGRVLVSDGWACEVARQEGEPGNMAAMPPDHRPEKISGS